MENLDQYIEKILYNEQEITQAAKRIGHQLTKDYEGKNPLVIAVLKGAIPWFADLTRRIDTHLEMDFMVVSSYSGETVSSGEVKILKDLDTNVEGRDIIFVEDIIDTGTTLRYLVDLLKYRHAKSVKICTLLDKPGRRTIDVQADYVGFEVPNEFVVGYGLDYGEKFRNLPYVGILKEEVYQK